MRIEIIAIGNEVLSGFTINTNAAYISNQLMELGYETAKHVVVRDDENELRQELQNALAENDLVICTGGLGPTCDDVTRQVAAELFESEFVLNEQIEEELKKRYGDFPTIKDQATVPAKAKILKNEYGTAPGFLFSDGKSILILLPGVPLEMKEMFNREVKPYFLEHFPDRKRKFRLVLNMFQLPESAVDPTLRELKEKFPLVTFGIYPGQGTLSVHFSMVSNSEEEAMQYLRQPFDHVSKQFADHIFSLGESLESTVHSLLIHKKLTLALAESCTGGAMAARFTALPGSSNYFLGSMVTYSNELKEKVLGVSRESLQTHGAVSPEVAKEMVLGLMKLTQCDIGISVTGIAGPDGGTPEKPVGTVWGAICKKGEEPYVWKLWAKGNRQMVIERSINALMAKLYKIIKPQGR